MGSTRIYYGQFYAALDAINLAGESSIAQEVMVEIQIDLTCYFGNNLMNKRYFKKRSLCWN